jgi:uncharacterized repeat protein (TIGR01451 family)
MTLLIILVSAVTALGGSPDGGPEAVEPPVVALKVLAPEKAAPSGHVGYRVLVKNFSPTKAFGVQVRFDLPEGATFVESDPKPDQAQKTLIWSLGQLTGKAEREIKVLLQTKLEGPFDACFRVAFEHGVCVTTQGVCKPPMPPEEKLPPPKATAKLSVVKTAPAAQGMGTPIAYSINVVNDGPVTLRGVEVEDLLPPRSTYVPGSADHNGQLVAAENKKLLWRLGTLLPRESRTVTFKVRANEVGTFLNVARARGLDPDGQPVTSQDSTATTQISGAATLYMEVRDSRDPLFVSEETSYSITIRNTGTAPAANIRVVADVPPGLTVKRMSPPDDPGATAFRPGEARIAFGAFTLQPGESKSFEVGVQVQQPGVWRFRTTLTSDVIDPAKGSLIEEETTSAENEKPPDSLTAK